MSVNGGDGAFAAGAMAMAEGDRYQEEWQCGLTKRELFAAMAMQGIMGSPEGGDTSTDVAAFYSVKCADALIAALNEEAP